MRIAQRDDERDVTLLRCSEDPTDRIAVVKELFVSTGAAQASIREMEKYTAKANSLPDKINISEDKKEAFRGFGDWLMKRKV